MSFGVALEYRYNPFTAISRLENGVGTPYTGTVSRKIFAPFPVLGSRVTE
jgi:hypothetical protein